MTSRSKITLASFVAIVAVAASFALRNGVGRSDARTNDVHATPKAAVPEKSSLSATQSKLLDLAFAAASRMPLAPHVKTRSRLQEDVVVTCLKLNDGDRALRLIPEIADWRRGTAYADYAQYLARRSEDAEARRYAQIARGISESDKFEFVQDWQRARIRVKVAGVYTTLGDADRALEVAKDAERSEIGKLGVAEVAKIAPEAFAGHMEALDQVCAVGDLDQIRNALGTYAALHARFYADSEKRDLVELKVMTAIRRVPPMVRVDALGSLSDTAVKNTDPAKAKSLIDAARDVIDREKWLPEDKIPMLARLASLRHAAGDALKAAKEVDLGLATFYAERERIMDIERGRALRALADALHAMDDDARAFEMIKLVLDESLVNPNSRPRTEDLCATLCLLALHGMTPDPALMARLEKIAGGLGDPW